MHPNIDGNVNIKKINKMHPIRMTATQLIELNGRILEPTSTTLPTLPSIYVLTNNS